MPSEIRIQHGRTIYDVSIQLYGSINYVQKILTDNPSISVDYDFSANPGTIIIYDEVIIQQPVLDSLIQVESNIKTFKSHYGQSLYDVCMMIYGDISLLAKLMTDNGIINSNETYLYNKDFIFDTDYIVDKAFYNNLILTNKKISTVEARTTLPVIGRAYSRGYTIGFS